MSSFGKYAEIRLGGADEAGAHAFEYIYLFISIEIYRNTIRLDITVCFNIYIRIPKKKEGKPCIEKRGYHYFILSFFLS